MGNTELFTTRMRKSTRKIHSISDALVNAKFAIALKNSDVWSGGLFVFYHIFAFLEETKTQQSMREFGDLFVHDSLFRTKCFEQDLAHYMGENWKKQLKVSKPIIDYLHHLQKLEKENPRLLLAYVYHLYLGLLSGGQILAKKRAIFGDDKNANDKYVDQVTNFEGVSIVEIKNQLKEAINKIADQMTTQEKQDFIEESNKVFVFNNGIVQSVDGQNRAMLTEILRFTPVVVVVLAAFVVVVKLFTYK